MIARDSLTCLVTGFTWTAIRSRIFFHCGFLRNSERESFHFDSFASHSILSLCLSGNPGLAPEFQVNLHSLDETKALLARIPTIQPEPGTVNQHLNCFG